MMTNYRNCKWIILFFTFIGVCSCKTEKQDEKAIQPAAKIINDTLQSVLSYDVDNDGVIDLKFYDYGNKDNFEESFQLEPLQGLEIIEKDSVNNSYVVFSEENETFNPEPNWSTNTTVIHSVKQDAGKDITVIHTWTEKNHYIHFRIPRAGNAGSYRKGWVDVSLINFDASFGNASDLVVNKIYIEE